MDLSRTKTASTKTAKTSELDESFLLNDDAFSALWKDKDQRIESKPEPARPAARHHEYESVFRVR